MNRETPPQPGRRTHLDRLRSGAEQEEGSLALVMLILLIGLALGAVLVPTVLTQDRSTVFVASRENSLAAAQGGINVIVGRIRASFAGTSVGDPRRLPCAAPATPTTPANPTTGVIGSPNTARYSVTVSYFTVDPVQNPGTVPMICVQNRGTFDLATGTTVPGYALITSTGADGTAGSGSGRSTGRTLQTTYVFKTTNRAFPSGQIRVYPPAGATSSPLCWDTTGTPAVGTAVRLQACSQSVPPARQQLFAYRTDLTLQLSPPANDPTNGLCLDTSSSPGAPALNAVATLKACSALGSPPFSQQWSFNDKGGFTTATATTATTGQGSFAVGATYPLGLCLSAADQTVGRQLQLADCQLGDVRSTTQAWIPVPSVGAGAAAAPQLVNFDQFGRCLDVTAQNTGADHLQAFPCKQNPYPGAVNWNQTFTFTGTAGSPGTSGQLTTTTGGVKYCVVSPRTESGSVRLTPCAAPAGATAAQLQWKSLGSAKTVPYSQRYTFVDSSTDVTRCLSIADPPATDASPWSYAVVATCNGSTAQKWNADADIAAPSLQNTVETPIGSTGELIP